MSQPVRRSLVPLASLAAGLLAGVAGTYALAPAPLAAEVTDRNDKMVMFTSTVSIGRPAEAVFVLDSTTGSLVGGVIGANGGFNTSYLRNVAADFGDRAGRAEYAVVSGGSDSGSGVIYIAENRSGMVVAYGLPPGGGALVPAGKFNFKQPVQ